MTTTPTLQDHTQEQSRTAVPADVDAPDKIAWGLTARQLAILAAAGTAGYGLHQMLTPLLPQLLAAVGLPAGGLVMAVVLGRRDGLGLDQWAARRGQVLPHPRRQTSTPAADTPPGGLVHVACTLPVPAPLRLPAQTITQEGTLMLPGRGPAAVVAAGTVNLGLRTSANKPP